MATVGIYLPIVTVDFRSRSGIPVVTDLVDAIPSRGFDASADQRFYLLGVVALALTGWLLPRLAPRLGTIGWILAVAAAAIATIGATRAWVIALQGPGALVSDDSSFLERSALTLLDRLHSYGVLVIHPAAGLWVLSAGALLQVLGALGPLVLRSTEPRGLSGRP